MAVNSYLICEKLERYVCRKLDKCTTECKIKYVMIFNPQISVKSDTAYIVVDNSLFPSKNSGEKGLMITLEQLDEDVEKATIHDYICVGKDFGLGRLYENIHEILEAYVKWEDAMGSMLVKGHNLSAICSSAVDFLGNPLTVQEENYKIIGVGETEEIQYPYDFREGDSDYLSEEWINSSLKYEKEVFTRKGPFEFHYIKKHSSLLYNIFLDDKYVAQICVDANHRKIVIEDYVRICILGKYVRQYLKYDTSRHIESGSRFRSQFRQFIQGVDTKKKLEVSLTKRNWSVEDRYICCVVTKVQIETKDISMGYFCHRWEIQIPGCVCLNEDSTIYMLINIGQEKKLQNSQWERLEELARTNKSRIGVSQAFCGFFKCREYFEQAKAALRLGNELPKKEWVVEYSKHKLSYVIQYGTKSLPSEILMPDALKRLMEYDKDTDSDFCKTLRVYLKNNLNITETGNELFLHRNTLKYRIQRIKEIMDFDLEDHEEQLYLKIILYNMENNY